MPVAVLGAALRGVGKAVLVWLSLVLLYLLAAGVGAVLPVNADYRPTRNGIPVYLQSNGVHVDLVVPISADCACSPSRAPSIAVLEQPFDPRVPPERWHWVALGWGSEQFMLNVSSWSELTAGVALRAVSGLDGSVIRLSNHYEPAVDKHTRRLLLTVPEYRRLLGYVRNSIGPHPQERYSALASPADRFYRASGHYSPFNTCNEWVSKGLAGAGIRTPLWAPFDWALLDGSGG